MSTLAAAATGGGGGSAAAASKVNNPFDGAGKSVTASGSSLVYEGERAVHEYLQFHYGRSQDVMPFDCGPTQALDFTKRCADLCTDTIGVHKDQNEQADESGEGKEFSNTGTSSNQPPLLRAIDVGCAVGGITFELTRTFDEVIGVDYSANFVQAARRMREDQRMTYQCLEQGSIVLRREAVLPEGTIPSRARFEQGDACALDVKTLGAFDVVLASNLLCRLPSPRAFLSDLPALVKPGGVAVLISPYSWLEEYTPPSEWLGGFRDDNREGQVVDSFDTIRALMEAEGRFKLEKRLSMPFLIREHARKFQWGCSDGTVWRRQ